MVELSVGLYPGIVLRHPHTIAQAGLALVSGLCIYLFHIWYKCV